MSHILSLSLSLDLSLIVSVITEKVVILYVKYLSTDVYLNIGLISNTLICFVSPSLSVRKAVFGGVNGKIFQLFLEDIMFVKKGIAIKGRGHSCCSWRLYVYIIKQTNLSVIRICPCISV